MRSQCKAVDQGLLVLLLLTLSRQLMAGAIDIDWNGLRDVDDEAPAEIARANWKVVCFLGTECPIAQFYGPRLQELESDFKKHGLRVVGVVSNLQDSAEDIRQYATKHELTYPIIRDDDQSLARQFGATRTPEVFLLDQANKVRYQGRIDDQYSPGLARGEAVQHDLQNAIDACVSGKPVPVVKTEAVGCLITFVKNPAIPTDSDSIVTFSRDVAPILNRHCVECHRDGEIAPFALTDYDEVVGWSEMMLEVIEDKRMPPWHADPQFGKFVGARHFPKESYETLAAWVKQGMPRGEETVTDENAISHRPHQTNGWHLPSPPDQVLAMREEPYIVPKDGTVEYQYFVVDPNWNEDRWVRAAQVIPGSSSIVHHCIVFVRPPDGSHARGIGWLGGYVPGQRVGALPTGHARRIPAGSKLVFQMHYTPNGRQMSDLTKIGVWLADAEEVTHEVTTRVAVNQHFEIPPRARDHLVHLRLDRFAEQSRLLGVMPHMHLRGKSFRLNVHRSNASQAENQPETLLYVPHYDFNWQHWYQLQTPLALDDVESLRMQVQFDNSAKNPANPAPNEFVTWGDQTWEEMAVAFLDIAHPRGKPRIVKQHANQQQVDETARQTFIDRETKKFLSEMDRNGDGFVVPTETPDTFRRFGFNRIDRNRDGRIERDEVEAAAASRF